jgi:hypothetical protein
MDEAKSEGSSVAVASESAGTGGTPRVIPARGGFLAVSSGLMRPRIGVLAATEDEARVRFSEAMRESLSILARGSTSSQ